ncbi:hypothetical protein [Streptomyces sp. NPDC001139]
MSEPELHVRDLTPRVRAVLCGSGRHVAHPGDTCKEFDELQAAFRAYFERALADAYAEAERLWLTGSSTGEARGFLAGTGLTPTPMQRALAILDPHLRACPLYRPGEAAIAP